MLEVVLTAVLAIILICLSVVDLRVRRLPNHFTLPLIVGGLAITWVTDRQDVAQHSIAAAVGYASIALLGYAYFLARGRQGIGLGDGKLVAAAGAWLGPMLLPVLILVASTSAISVQLIMHGLGRKISTTRSVAFGPYLCAAFFALWLSRDATW
jgi:leader peptidase (prepilin peptidase) / N-methyltransferase